MIREDLLLIAEWLDARDSPTAAACGRRASSEPALVAEAQRQRQLHLLLRVACQPGDPAAVARRARMLASSESSRRVRVRRIVLRARGQSSGWPPRWLMAAVLVLTLTGAWLAWPMARSVGDLGPGAVVQRGTEQIPSASGLLLRAGDVITSQSTTRMRFRDGTELTLGEGMRLQVVEAQGWLGTAAKTLVLENGVVQARVAHQPDGFPLTIATPEVLVTVLGTEFVLTARPGSSTCAVQSGLVSVRHGGIARAVPAGSEVRCDRDGFVPSAAASGAVLAASPQPEALLRLRGDIAPVANPELVAVGSRLYLFSQGPGIALRTATELSTWSAPRRVFSRDLPWWSAADPKYRLWSPSIAAWGGKYWLYYVVTVPGEDAMILGLASATSLEPAADGAEWSDHGPILRLPRQGTDEIGDPQAILDDAGQPWLVMGSGQTAGITIRPLDPTTGRIQESAAVRSLALGHHAQAPSIHFRAGWYYLFFATGNYRTDFTAVVGRSRSLFGPYADRAGVELMRGGRTVVTQGTADLIAPANGCVLTWEGRDYFVTNVFRPAADGGKTAQRELVICPLVWDAAGWPRTALTPRP